MSRMSNIEKMMYSSLCIKLEGIIDYDIGEKKIILSDYLDSNSKASEFLDPISKSS